MSDESRRNVKALEEVTTRIIYEKFEVEVDKCRGSGANGQGVDKTRKERGSLV